MDAEEIQDHAGDQKQLIDVRVGAGVQISQLQLLHGGLGLRRGNRAETDAAGSVRVDLDDHVVRLLVLPGQLVSRRGHHHFMQQEDRPFGKAQMFIARMDSVQGVPVAGNLRFVVVPRRAALPDDRGNPLVAGDDPLDGVGAFDRLNLGDLFQLGKHLSVVFLTNACRGSQGIDVSGNAYQLRRQHSVVQERVVKSSHFRHVPPFLHIS